MKKYTVEINAYGTKVWRNEKGQKHREDGPAVEYADGGKDWHLNDIQYTEQEFLIKMRKVTVTVHGDKIWHNEKGQFHREDGPAIELVNGAKHWYLNGKEYTELEFNKIMNPTKFVEMTMEEIEKLVGCPVKIVKSH